MRDKITKPKSINNKITSHLEGWYEVTVFYFSKKKKVVAFQSQSLNKYYFMIASSEIKP